jgi:hypothetical protein
MVASIGRVRDRGTRDHHPYLVQVPRHLGDWRNWRSRIWRGEGASREPPQRSDVPRGGAAGNATRDLRSSFITLQIYASVPLMTVAKQCGASLPMIEKHYAGVIENWDGVQAPAEHRIHAARTAVGRGVDVQPIQRP